MNHFSGGWCDNQQCFCNFTIGIHIENSCKLPNVYNKMWWLKIYDIKVVPFGLSRRKEEAKRIMM